MAYTVQQVLTAANLGMADLVMTSAEAIAAINEAIGWMGDMAYRYIEGEVTVTDAELYAKLPDDCIHVTAINGENPALFDIQGDYIYFDRAGTYQITYRTMAPKVTAVSDNVPLHALYEQPLVGYLRAWTRAKDEEDEPTAGTEALRQTWMQDASKAFGQLRRNRIGPATAKCYRDARDMTRRGVL